MEQTKIQTFLDGTCDLYAQDENGKQKLVRENVPYQLRTVGSRRFYEAAQIGHTISRVIRVPDIGRHLNDCQVVIHDGTEKGLLYQILQAQEIMDTNPRCLQLSLEQPNICWAAEREE